MAAMGIKFVPLPEWLQERVTNVMRKIEAGEIDPSFGGKFFMNYFSQRLGIILENYPDSAELEKAAKGQRFAVIIKGSVDYYATFGDKITDFTTAPGSKPSDPAMIFYDMDTFLDVILSKKELLRAGFEKKLEVRKMAKMLRWMAPILALQTDDTQKILEEKCPPILNKVIDEIEAETGLKL